MLARNLRFPCVLVAFALACAACLAQVQKARVTTPLVIDRFDVGTGTVPLDGAWQFLLGDHPEYADPSFDDSRAEQLSADRPWGVQGHPSYVGFAWYRRHIDFKPPKGVPVPDTALLIPHIDDAYEIYWNGKLFGRNGKLPPFPEWYEFSQPAQTFNLGPVRSGVLAIRVWKAPLISEDSGLRGGFEGIPLAGSSEAISARKNLLAYEWLRSRQFDFALNLLYGLIGVLSLLAWLRDRRQWPLFWMSVFALARIFQLLIYGLHLPWYLGVANAVWQPISSFRDIALWYLLLSLLELRDKPALVRLTRTCAYISVISTVLDGFPYFLGWIPALTLPIMIADAALTAIYILVAGLPLVLVIAAVFSRKRLDIHRWLVALLAFTAGMFQTAEGILPQGQRFTHWTFAEKIDTPLFIVRGNTVSVITATGLLLLFAIVYAVYRNSDENRRRQNALEQEFQSARALQQVLIPVALPSLPGFALTSAYRPAQEVGGDFFQIIPLDGALEGSSLVIVGDVSGKGLKAAMSVSFIVGAIRALANLVPDPGELLAELNRRLFDRLQGGFATCVVLRLDPDGRGSVASAGHPAPFLNRKELELPGALPLGVVATATFQETSIQFRVGDHCTLYTDGLLEARNHAGALYGFERLSRLLAARLNAAQAADAAVRFGQDDDITVVTLTRVRADATSSVLSAPDRNLPFEASEPATPAGP
jgi:hypothetical protein